MTYDEIKKNKEVCECLKKGNENLGVLGFTDHSAAHCTMVAKRAAYILKKFGYSESDIEMVKIAGFMHDTGTISWATDWQIMQADTDLAFRRMEPLF